MLVTREQGLKNLQAKQFDILIVGGGATGLGAALDAISRGFSVALVEQSDFAKCTSSKSTKLLHGGVRYLEQLNFKLVREGLLERQYFYRNAPHISENLAYAIPCYDYFSIPFFYSGLKLYDGLAGFPKGQCSSFLSRSQTLKDFPYLKPEGLTGAIQYFDGQFNDAQMAVTLAKTCREKGGVLLNYSKLVNFIKVNNKVAGGLVKDVFTGEEYEVKAKCVINATSIFSDDVCRLDDAAHQESLTLAQGVHLIAKNNIGLTKALLIPKTADGRVLFCLPWQDVLILGTTDVAIKEHALEALSTQQEIDFILDGVSKYFPELKKDDLLGHFAGIRPLVKAEKTESKKTSREEKISISRSGLVSIIGGKWTTYRHMGERIISMAIENQLLPKAPVSSTKTLALSGWIDKDSAVQIPIHFRHYGSYFEALKQLPDFEQKIHPDLPYSVAEIEVAIKYSFAETVDDFLARRTRALYTNPKAAMQAVPLVASKMASILGKDQAWIDAQIEEMKNLEPYYLLDKFM